ncbi:cartilage intermediate layer protein 1-like [Ruditapes philippinarum]|uniref:cartilage intermediate layer protein 1-like n=1 Tax=Ruditapes philippinarum TaxID=129788 RepID=UPI00295A8E5A|nr:cartilage intermediate layer protein 1-like [Ruditapes philippinarum]
MILVSSILLCLVYSVVGETGQRCTNSPIDIAIALDTSDIVTNSHFEAEKTLTKEIASNIFNQDNRLALVTFAEQATIQFNLDTYKSLNDLNLAIDFMWRATGQSRLEEAINYSLIHGFTGRNATRQSAPKFLIVVSHSRTLNDTQFNRISDKLQENMVELLFLDNQSSSTVQKSNIKIQPSPTTSTVANITKDVIDILCKGAGVLKPWTQWSACGRTCGTGIRRRFKECVKRRENDTCLGKNLETEKCTMRQCTDSIDGGWTYWTEWSKCTKTCDSGKQTRQRYCSAPVPANGGSFCKGPRSQQRNCSDWKCPDCSFVCGKDATLSSKCDVCLCINTTLLVKVKSNTNVPLETVEVHILSISRKRLGVTDSNGTFLVKNVCLRNASIILHKDGYVDETISVKQENNINLNITQKIYRMVSPMILKHPENKVRVINQNATLCCIATGRPKPASVHWFKDGIELPNANKLLVLTNISLSDAGVYSCTVETEAGIVKSEEASLKVVAIADKQCSNPLLYSRKLPTSCYAEQNGSNVTVVDIGKCSREHCQSKVFTDEETCSDKESNYCCEENQTTEIEVFCPGFSYKLKRIKSCACKICMISSTVEGSAYGKHENGSKIPFAYGFLYIDGKKAAVTNERGYFHFELLRSKTRAIVYFVDETFYMFVPTTKIMVAQRDSTSFVTVVLPLKPNPIKFDSHLGISISLGGSNNLPPVGGITIPEHALITSDGMNYTGKAKATVHFMDPRKLSDLEASNGNFVYNTPDGSTGPLETFGMFRTTVEDDKGFPLKVKKKLQFNLDASIFNVSFKDDGSPDLALWNYDINNGIWVETAKMMLSDSNFATGRRKLLANVLVGEYEVQEIDHIDLTEDTPVMERVIIGYTNCDHSVPIYGDRIVKHDSKTKRNACYLSVSVYSDLTFRERSAGGTNIVAITQEMYGQKFQGMDSKTTDTNGHACLSVFCDSKVYVYAENKIDGSRLYASQSHDLPVWYENFNNTKNNTEVEIFSYDIDDITENGKTRYSPFVSFEDFSKCNEEFEKSYKFQFAYNSIPHALTTTISKDTFDNALSWYPVSPEKPYGKSCFIKVAIKTDDNDARFIAQSYQNKIENSKQYGTYEVSPTFDVSSPDKTQKAACIEYRCAGQFAENGTIKYNAKTIVDINLISTRSCTIRILTKASNMSVKKNNKGFTFVADPSRNYGPDFGIYVGNGNADKISSFCASGIDSGAVEKIMKPYKNTAVEFSCT